MNREDVLKYVLESYGTSPEFPWIKSPDSTVLRHSENRKWYAVIMNVKEAVLGFDGDSKIDILNVKITALAREYVLSTGIGYPGYHMNKEHWISLPLDDRTDSQIICSLIDESYNLTK